MMLRLYVVLNQLLVKAFFARRLMVSSRATLVNRDVTSYDTIMSLSLNEVLRISSANLNVSVIVCSLMDNGFSFSSSHFAWEVVSLSLVFRCQVF